MRDSVSVWLEGAGRTKLLTAAEEVGLARKVREWLDFEGGPDRAPVRVRWIGRRAKERMVAANLRLVMTVSQRFAWATRDGGALALEDLLQEGTLGLIRAVEKFDHTKGYKFSTYAYWWIRQAMSRAIHQTARTIRLPVHISEKLGKLSAASAEVWRRTGETPTVGALAEAVGMEVVEVRELLLLAAPTTSTDRAVTIDGAEEASKLIDLLAAPDDAPDADDRAEVLRQLLPELPPRLQRVVELRQGGATLTKVGADLGINRERARQLETKAIRQLREMAA